MCHTPVQRLVGLLAVLLLVTAAAGAPQRHAALAPRGLPPIATIRAPERDATLTGLVHVAVTIGAPGSTSFAFRLDAVPADRVGRSIPLAALNDVPCAPGSPAAAGVPLSAAWDTGGLPDGLYRLRLRVRDGDGNVRETYIRVRVAQPGTERRPGVREQRDGGADDRALA